MWLYKDKMGHVQGPFMSYDMDIWNGEGNYFADDLKVALLNNTFLPIEMYLDRHQLVIDIVQSFLAKAEHLNKADPKRSFDANKKHNNNNHNNHNNNNNNNKKYSFQKKPETEADRNARPNFNSKTPLELNSNFQENFPSLNDPHDKNKSRAQTNQQSSSSQTKNGPSLLDTLRGPQSEASNKAQALPAHKEGQPMSSKDANEKRGGNDATPQKPVDENMLQQRSQAKTAAVNSQNKRSRRQTNENGLENDSVAIKYVEKPNGPIKPDGNKELTDNIKNLLGLGFK